MKQFVTRRRLIAAALIVIVALFAFRPGVNGLRKRIVNSISLALGHKVEIQWVKLRFLPQPGFELVNFVVYDDPAFSAEPMLRSGEVTATLRLRSLLHGRVEIGRLDLKEPSFNLVRNQEGRWNLASLVERAAHTPTAPTSHTRPEAHPVFPYIEADNGRINFRIGAEKKSYALTDADFALWLESENQWGMRLRAVPVRTDFNVSDTGTLRVNASWLRSETLAETPVKVEAEWERAQLGQVTKLFSGTDKGWRGELNISTALAGTPTNLQVNTQASLQDFRRYDIVPTQSLRLAASCNANYSSATHVVSQILCVAPVGKGILAAQGSITAPTGPRRYELSLAARDVPIQSIVSLARRAKKDLAPDLQAAGTLAADLSVRTATADAEPLWAGKGETSNFRIRSEVVDTELELGKVPFELGSGSTGTKKLNASAQPAADTIATVGPFDLTLGKGHLLAVNGWIGHSGYELSLRGDAHLQRLLQAAQTLGIPAPQPLAAGVAKLDVKVAGAWAGFASPITTGTAQLHAVRAETRGLNGPIEIDSASLRLSDSGVRVSKLVAKGGGAHWTGSLSFPRQCRSLSACPVNFDLQADTIAYERLHDWLTPRQHKRPWYRFLSSSTIPGPSLLLGLNAAGSLWAGKVVVGDIAANNVSGKILLQDGKLQISDIAAEVLGGRHRGELEADLAATPPVYSGEGLFEGVLLNQVAQAMQDGWISGTGTARYQFASHGRTRQELLDNGAVRVDFDTRGGELTHIKLVESAGPLRVRRFTGQLVLRDGSFHIEQGKLDTPAGIYLVSGTASFGQKLDVMFTRSDGRAFNVTGPLSSPHVALASSPETTAALKP